MTGPLLLLLLPPHSSPPRRLRQQRPAPGTRQPPGRGSLQALRQLRSRTNLTHALPLAPGALVAPHHFSHPTRISGTLERTKLKASAFEATRLADVYLRAPEPRLYLNLYGCSHPTPANPALVLACCHRGLASDSKFFLSIWQMRSLRYLRLHQIIFQAGCVCVQTWPVSAKCDPLTPSIITARKRKTSSSSINCSMRLISGPQHHRLTATCHQKVKPAGPDPEDR